MKKTFKDLRLKYHYPLPAKYIFGYNPIWDDYTLYNPQQVVEIFTHLKEIDALPFWADLFKEPINLSGYTSHSNYELYLALQGPTPDLITYLSSLPEFRLADLIWVRENLFLIYSNGNLKALEPLLLLPMTDQSIESLSEFLNWAIQMGNLEIVDRLLKLPEIMARAIAEDNALCSAARYGQLNIVSYLLELPEIRAHTQASIIQAFLAAVGNGHLAVVNYLLEISEVRGQAAARNNYALYVAALYGHVDIVNRLMELSEVRQSTLNRSKLDETRRNHIDRQFDLVNRLLELPQTRKQNSKSTKLSRIQSITQGLERALWLNLQKSSNFKKVKNFNEPERLADKYLVQRANWMCPTSLINNQELVASLKNQVISLRFYGYMNHVKLQNNAPSRNLIEAGLKQDWVDNINQFISLPKSLTHFEEHQSLRIVAAPCLKQWSLDAKLNERKSQWLRKSKPPS